MPQVVVQEPVTKVTVTAPEEVTVTVAESVTQVTVQQLAGSLSTVAAAADVDMSAAAEGALLVYRASLQKFEVRNTTTISQADPSGGQHGDVWLKYMP